MPRQGGSADVQNLLVISNWGMTQGVGIEPEGDSSKRKHRGWFIGVDLLRISWTMLPHRVDPELAQNGFVHVRGSNLPGTA